MEEKQPSRTAMATAFLRAAHICLDDDPPVLDDPISILLLPDYQRLYLKGASRLSNPWSNRLRSTADPFNAMRAQIVVRAKFAEDALEQAQEAGAERYLVFAAGLDTYAWRRPSRAIEVLEIDHPATQSWKRELIARAELDMPDDISFLPINFEQQTLDDILPKSAAPDFISWLGTTYYLSKEAIAHALTSLAKTTSPGTQIVFDFWSKTRLVEAGNPLLLGTRIAVALQREPMRSFFNVEDIRALAATAGWEVLDICTPSEQNERYLGRRTDRLKVPSFAYLAHLENRGATKG